MNNCRAEGSEVLLSEVAWGVGCISDPLTRPEERERQAEEPYACHRSTRIRGIELPCFESIYAEVVSWIVEN
jgi:hypothetical protein